ncbi:GAF domain-containing protein [Candidatus Oscillochloris fontis]|uniref:GAF domain-containing protein n=1 Tax=Candidatus Oscillochloris fontis TaxID=2496868 RepID=UPI00101DF684|nr:GAF domain-containing protein [Candidatus Oscillochloris fontis]
MLDSHEPFLSVTPAMSQIPHTSDSTESLWPQQMAEVAHVQSPAELAQRVALVMEHILPMTDYDLVWASEYDQSLLDAEVRAKLLAGTHVPGTSGRPGYIPIHAGKQLVGWLRLMPGHWNASQGAALTLLASILGLLSADLRVLIDECSLWRYQLRSELLALRDIRNFDHLLVQIAQIVEQTFDHVNFMIALRYQQSSWVEMVYFSINGTRLDRTVFWEDYAGLSGYILKHHEPISTENYLEECRQRHITPLYVTPDVRWYAWIGAPLRDADQVFGVISCSTLGPDICFSPDQFERLLMLAEELAHPLRNAQLLRRAEQQAQQMQALNQIARVITSTLDQNRVPALIIERAQALFNAEEGSLLLLDEETRELVFSYAGGPAGHQLLGQRLPSGAGVAGHVVTSAQPAVVNNVRSDGRFYSLPDGDTGFATRSLIAVPLRGIDGVKGVIEILNRRDNAPFTDEDRLLLEAIADHAMIALENANRFAQVDQTLARRAQDLDRSNDRLRRILRVSNALRAERNRDELLQKIVQSVAESSGFQTTMLALVQPNDNGDALLQYMLATGPGASYFEHLSTVRVPVAHLKAILRLEFQYSASTYLIDRHFSDYVDLWQGALRRPPYDARLVPAGTWHPYDVIFSLLRNMHGEILGLIAVSDPEDGMQPDPDQIQILEIFANQASVALENAQLYHELQHSLRSLTALNGLGMALNTTLRSSQEIYQMTVAGMMAHGDARWGMALLEQTDSVTLPLSLAAHVGEPTQDQAAVEALAREAIRLRRPQMIPPGANGAEAVVAIPLRATRGVLGSICIGYAGGLPRYTEIERLSLFAGQAAVAAESLQLFTAVRQGRDQLASIMASTREGMLLVDEHGLVLVANDAFRELADVFAWPSMSEQPELAGQMIYTVLANWQAANCYPPGDLDHLCSCLAQVADGRQRFLNGQLVPILANAIALEWGVLPALPEGSHDHGHEHLQTRWPILLTFRDITDAIQAERLRQDLTSMMVHDLRSPLTSIITSIDMIFRGTVGEATSLQREILNIAYSSTQHLLDMVNLLLDISRLESRQMPLDCTSVDLYELAQATIERMTMIAQKQHVTITLQSDREHLYAHADRELIMRVLQNLLDNAIKFSPAHQQVLLSLQLLPQQNRVRVAVRDVGAGIKALDKEKIFTKFGQIGNRRSSGSGLGLTFCKLVVEAHAGEIDVESAPGQGSTFFFTLPAATVP